MDSEVSPERGWTAARQAGFLAALREGKTVRQACAAQGLTPAGAYALRERDAGFAQGWQAAATAGQAAVAAARAAMRTLPRTGALHGHRERHDGWTAARQKSFLRALAETGCVRDACKRARISSTSAYRLRQHSPDFAAAWNRAQAKGAVNIEQAAYVRAVEGWDETVTRGGEVVSVKRRYSDSLLRVLLQRGDLRDAQGGTSQAEREIHAEAAAKAAGGRFAHPREYEGAQARLEAKLAEMAERLREDETACPACHGLGTVFGEEADRVVE